MYGNQNERLNGDHRIFRSFLFPPSCCQDFSSLSRNCKELLWDDRIFVRYEPVKRQNFHALAAATTSQARRNQPGFPIHQTTLNSIMTIFPIRRGNPSLMHRLKIQFESCQWITPSDQAQQRFGTRGSFWSPWSLQSWRSSDVKRR